MLQQDQSKQFLLKLAKTKMPYGKYKGRYMIDLPEHYIIWYKTKGFPKGQIGEMLATVYELKVNGLEYLVRNLQKLSDKN
jgi:uncharacterized protein (DUF3820 family)